MSQPAELAANACVHGLPPVLLAARLDCEREGQVVTVRVGDASSQLPELEEVAPLGEHGRGLGIVDALALRWETHRTPAGKETWFEFELAAPAIRSSGRGTDRSGPFGMNDDLYPGASRSEELAS